MEVVESDSELKRFIQSRPYRRIEVVRLGGDRYACRVVGPWGARPGTMEVEFLPDAEPRPFRWRWP